jgi:hypothetical protein
MRNVQVIENMVARDGVEPPTPAFSDLGQPELTTTYRFAGDCQVPTSTCKPTNHGLESWAVPTMIFVSF